MLNYQYLSGLLDGEGYFGIIPSKKVKKTSFGYFYAVIKVSSTNEEIINLLQDNFGGYKEKRIFRPHNNSKLAYTWVAKNRESIKRILENIRPYLVIKKKIANIMYEFITTRWFGKRKIPEDIIRWRDELYIKSRQLNHRGLSPATTERTSSFIKDEATV